jgi:hypothetical protein
VISSAYGVYFDRTFSNAFSNMRYNALQVANVTSYPTSFDGTQSSGAISTAQVYNVVSVDPSIRTPYTQRFNLTVSQQVDKDSSLTLSYVGSIGTKLIATERPNMGASFPAAFRRRIRERQRACKPILTRVRFLNTRMRLIVSS